MLLALLPAFAALILRPLVAVGEAAAAAATNVQRSTPSAMGVSSDGIGDSAVFAGVAGICQCLQCRNWGVC